MSSLQRRYRWNTQSVNPFRSAERDESPPRKISGAAFDFSKLEGLQGKQQVDSSNPKKEALLLCQDGKEAEADVILARLGFQFRLAPPIFRAQQPTRSKSKEDATKFCLVVDDALPPQLLSLLHKNFQSGSQFWTSHGYVENAPNPYFSYAFPLEGNAGGLVRAALNAVLPTVRQAFPDGSSSPYSEE